GPLRCSWWRAPRRRSAGSSRSPFGSASCGGCRISCPITWRRARRKSSAPLPLLTERWRLAPLFFFPAMLAAAGGGGRGWGLHVGRWYNVNRADDYVFRTSSGSGGVYTDGFGAVAPVADSAGSGRA